MISSAAMPMIRKTTATAKIWLNARARSSVDALAAVAMKADDAAPPRCGEAPRSASMIAPITATTKALASARKEIHRAHGDADLPMRDRILDRNGDGRIRAAGADADQAGDQGHAQTGISGWTTSSATAAAAMLSITIGAHL